MVIRERIAKLRQLMKEHGIDAYIIPSSDPHQSEYVGEHFRCRQWISGFTGSAGTVVVTLDKAGLWTDGRYFIQAERQLKGSGIELFRMGELGVPSYSEWIKDELKGEACLGFDGKVFSISQVRKMKNIIGNKISFEDRYDLINELWEDRPGLPSDPIFIHDIEFAGKDRGRKIREVQQGMKKYGASHYLLTSLDDIAWLFNIRGNDIPSNPVVLSYAVISEEKAYLFIDKNKVGADASNEFESSGIEIMDYDDIDKFLKGLKKGDKILIDPDRTSIWLYNAIDRDIEKREKLNITTMMKAIKNDIEIKNLKKCYIKDCVALVKFIYWLKKNVGHEHITELSATEKLEDFRREQEYFMQPSFDTIAAYKDHAAMMHYKATSDSDCELEREGFLLVDSGGQYLDGTTDITRTIVLGDVSDEAKRDFTLVLKGHIALSTIKFLYGITGSNLDVLARRPIWEYGMDYKCGTGHGVGFCLNVHEGPQRISPAPNNIRLEKGMILTNEPGIYKEGKYGIRTENDLLVVEDEVTEFGKFMRFETISYCPIDIEGIDASMLTEDEKTWLNDYHRKVYELLSPYLDEEERKWLEDQTREI